MLKMALPRTVAKPALKPSTSFTRKRKKSAVKNSGREPAMALMLAPLTPSVKLTPITLECRSKLEQDRHKRTEHTAIITSGISIPILNLHDFYNPTKTQTSKTIYTSLIDLIGFRSFNFLLRCKIGYASILCSATIEFVYQSKYNHYYKQVIGIQG